MHYLATFPSGGLRPVTPLSGELNWDCSAIIQMHTFPLQRRRIRYPPGCTNAPQTHTHTHARTHTHQTNTHRPNPTAISQASFVMIYNGAYGAASRIAPSRFIND
ncbi:hypothetical protein CHARACLAT_023646 [Characodon lateralis]|uniref:Uncharacterized protein n=1 Tax=Characodon lateralis TaxID=208331 RepID=A0ABU7DJ81_9TELE|nr:hypothetical protein [Characodon lateralis]